MANGERCKYCGWQETEHQYDDLVENPRKRRLGYRKSLKSCEGFVSEIKNKPREIDRFEMENLEQQARSRAAWGLYHASVRQQKFDQELDRIESPEERSKFIAEAEKSNARGFYIG